MKEYYLIYFTIHYVIVNKIRNTNLMKNEGMFNVLCLLKTEIDSKQIIY